MVRGVTTLISKISGKHIEMLTFHFRFQNVRTWAVDFGTHYIINALDTSEPKFANILSLINQPSYNM